MNSLLAPSHHIPLAKVREEIELENLAKMFLRERIKRDCWDEMTVKGKTVKVTDLVSTGNATIYNCV